MSNLQELIAPLTHVSSNKDKIHWGNLQGGAMAISIAQATAKHGKPTLLVVPDTPTALRLEAEIKDFLDPSIPLLSFPDWETLPYDFFSPHQDIISQRLRTLYLLRDMNKGLVILPLNTLMQRIAPASYLDAHTFIIKEQQQIDQIEIRRRLENAGYTAVNQVMEHGEFSSRGSLLDVYPMGSQHPYRIDFFDDEVDSIRLFDPESQRSGQTIKQIEMLPAHEFPTDDAGIELFRSHFREKFAANSERESLYYQVSKGIFPAGIEYYLPIFFTETATFFDYLPDGALLLTHGTLVDKGDEYWQDINRRYENRGVDPLRPLLAPAEVFLPPEQLFQQFKRFPRITLHTATLTGNDGLLKAGHFDLPRYSLDDIAIKHQQKDPFEALKALVVDIKQKKGRIAFCVESEGRREQLLDVIKPSGIRTKAFNSFAEFFSTSTDVGLIISQLETSVAVNLASGPVAFITETQLFGNRVSQRRRRKNDQQQSSEQLVKSLMELSEGQPVVHIDHGVGRYIGLQSLDVAGMKAEFLTLKYANDSTLYVPVSSLHLISRYTGADAEHAPLSNLGSDAWEKAKRRAAERVRDVAAELLDVYAQRAAREGYQYTLDVDSYRAFCSGFPFEETNDQQIAIDAVRNDMLSKQPMDRLVCGDVGFGKTEVALRAAFIAISEGKQVIILVPTTLLAQQHFENFQNRFANFPVKVALLSRFRTAKEQKITLSEMEAGQADIIIGTHKLLNKDIKYKDLGLLIVDEEHRFGVRQKEKVKSLRANIDILTLTATPIPRTLNMALSGMRDLSIISTPPAKRLAVKTFITQTDKNLIKEAIQREIRRGGQVYFLHNNVESIERTAEELSNLLPEANIVIGHGQMPEKELEQVMRDFYHQRFNVLVCTTIIETGIDVPTANTIIMDRADHLGLAQLHQLRGRVGRSHHQAYAYLLTPHRKLITKDAQKRLDALETSDSLGAGFTLATHDLEIRGAGELLGDEQSGQITSIGFTLYMEMLEEAVEALKEGKQPSLDNLLANQTEVEIRIPALFPDDYIPDVNLRLSMYKRIASCKSIDALDEINVELIDRFGLMPDAAKNLVKIQQLKIQAQNAGIQKIELGPKGGNILFADATNIDPMFIVQLVQRYPNTYKIDSNNRLKVTAKLEDSNDRIKFIEQFISELPRQQAKK